MTADGKQLEALVAFVEKTLLPAGFKVTTNERVFNEEGVQIAEFDIEIQGKVGSTKINWLIECRDRPNSGAAPGSWVEQLVGRRTRFGFNKVTAVSTTGFAPGAVDFAREQGIELREVKALEPDEFAEWLAIRHIHHIEKQTKLVNAIFSPHESEAEDRKLALEKFLATALGSAAFLNSSVTGEAITPANAFLSAVNGIEGVFEGVVPNGQEKKIRLHATYTDDSHFFVETAAGPVRIHTIVFDGELQITEELVPLTLTAEYRNAGGELISQVASFAPQSIFGMKFSTEMHRIAESGETHVIIRRLNDNA